MRALRTGAAVVAAVALVVGIIVFLRNRPASPPPVTATDDTDSLVIDFVFESMIPAVTSKVSHDCLLPPTRQAKGMIRVETKDDGIVITKWTASKPPPDWTAETLTCLEDHLVGKKGQPAKLKVPSGREYEVDVDLKFPWATVQ